MSGIPPANGPVRAGSPAAPPEARQDPLTGVPVVVVRGRQERPNLPTRACPFCLGGLEAPQPYKVRWFNNRWPAMPDERCEVVLFSPEHDKSLGTLDRDQLGLVVSLWAERTAALGARPDVAYVLIFENRGAEVGATIPHPHGQIYAFDHVPPVPLRELENDHCAICDELRGKGEAGRSHDQRVLSSVDGWQAWAVWAPAYPFELLLAPEEHIGDLGDARPTHSGLVEVLRATLPALDSLFGEPMPYMLWCHQRPTDARPWPSAHLHFHVAPTHRAKGVTRYVAAGELGSGVMFNPVDPLEAAQKLRQLARP